MITNLTDERFGIVKEGVMHNLRVKKYYIIIVLEDRMENKEIREIAIEVMKNYQNSQDVIWIYIAPTNDDYILSNWVMRGQWVNPKLPINLRPHTLKEKDVRGYYWEESKNWEDYSNYCNAHVFEDDKNLYTCNKKVYDEVKPICNELSKTYYKESFENFIEIYSYYKEAILKKYFRMHNFGRSRNKDFDDFLGNFQFLVSSIHNIGSWMEVDPPIGSLKYLIEMCLNDIEKYIQIIERDLPVWESELNIS